MNALNLKKGQSHPALLYWILEGALLIALLVFWIPSFVSNTITSGASFETVSEAVLATVDESVYPQQDNQKIKRYLLLDPADFDEIAFYRLDDAMSANELVVVKSSSAEALEAFAQAAQTRIDSQQSVYEGYAPEQAALMETALVDVQGNYALYYVGDSPAKTDSAFLKALQQEG